MTKKVKYLILSLFIISLLSFTGCMSGEGGGFDIVALERNPIFMVIVGGGVLWFMLKKKG